MATFLIHAGAEHLRRADGCDTGIVVAADATAARARYAQLLGVPAAEMNGWTVVDLATMVAPVAIQGRPVGAATQTQWPTLTRGGSLLVGA